VKDEKQALLTKPEPTRAQLGYPCLYCARSWEACKENRQTNKKRCCESCRGSECH
jgi:hypothetical protein